MKKMRLLCGIAVVGFAGFVAGSAQAAPSSADLANIKATVLEAGPDVTHGSKESVSPVKVKITNKDILQLAAVALGYTNSDGSADLTFGTGDKCALGLFTEFNDPNSEDFCVVDTATGNVIINLDAAFSDLGEGEFYIDTNDDVATGFDNEVPNGGEQITYSNFAWIYFYDGTDLVDGNLHSFEIGGVEKTVWKESFHTGKYNESVDLSGAGDTWDGDFDNLVGVVEDGSLSATGKGVEK